MSEQHDLSIDLLSGHCSTPLMGRSFGYCVPTNDTLEMHEVDTEPNATVLSFMLSDGFKPTIE
jgi:hypothetical protein